MHFEITKSKNFLGDACTFCILRPKMLNFRPYFSLNVHVYKIHILVHFDPPKKDLNFWIFSSLIVGLEFSYANNLPKLIYTYKSKLYILLLQIQIFLHKGALPWTPV